MTKRFLLSKLDKLGIQYTILNQNEFNKSIKFSINNFVFFADFNNDSTKIQSICTEYSFDQANQETERRFFDSFNSVLSYIKSKKSYEPTN